MINYTPETFNALTGPFLPFLGHPGGWAVGGVVAPSPRMLSAGVIISLRVGVCIYIYIYIYIHPGG